MADGESQQSDSDFIDIGDEGVIIVSAAVGFGEGGFGEGPFGGGEEVIMISGGETEWTNITEP